MPVLFLPLDGEHEVVVYRGYQDFTAASLATARVVDLDLDLLQ